jgi:hypothetical protein
MKIIEIILGSVRPLVAGCTLKFLNAQCWSTASSAVGVGACFVRPNRIAPGHVEFIKVNHVT